MSLKNLLDISEEAENKKTGMSEDRLDAQLDHLRTLISFYREYPDLLIDFMKGPESSFKFFFYQRVMIRIIMRHRYVYLTCPRAYSKSFLSMMVLVLRCMLYPNSHLFVTTGGKEQAASITMSKIEEICRLLPCLNNEINWERGASKKGKDSVIYRFKNGSILDILPARESSRGQRRTGGLIEEAILIDQVALNEIVIPTTNVDRQLPDGSRHREEIVNKSQVYITTAGFKNSFAYEKNIELLILSILDPNQAMICGGTYVTPVTEGLLDKNFVEDLKLQGTYNEDSFDREYRSKWTGDVDNAFFSAEKIDADRTIVFAEKSPSGNNSKSTYYILGVDVGRLNCTTEVCVLKVAPQPQGSYMKSLVAIYTYEAEHFEEQAIKIKKLAQQYKVRRIAIDANGLGVGLVDYLIKAQQDNETGDMLPPLGVLNDEDGEYKKYKTPDTITDMLYCIKANTPMNSEAYTYLQTQILNGKIKFLENEVEAKNRLMGTALGQKMTPDQRAEYLKPYMLTTILETQMLNLVQENEGMNIILKQSSKNIKKDKFSALLYAMYYVKQEEDRKVRMKKFDIGQLLFMN